MARFCKQCGGPLREGARFCRVCGAQFAPASAYGAMPLPPRNPQPARAPTRPSGHAPAQAPVQASGQTPGPLRYILGSIQNAFAGVKAAFKSPKLLLPTIVMTLIWTALSYLKLLLPVSILVYIASLFTFAQGGMYGGFIGAVGGLVGKALFSYVLSVTLMPLLTGQKRTKKLPAPRSPRRGMFPYALFGLGAALIVYHFMTGNASLENAMIGVTAFTACRKQRKSDSGFVVGLVLSFTKGRFTRADARPALTGLMAGFLTGVGLSLLQIGKLSAPMGLILAVLALLIGLFTRSKRLRAGVAAAALLLGAIALPMPVQAQASGMYLTPISAMDVYDDWQTYTPSPGWEEAINTKIDYIEVDENGRFSISVRHVDESVLDYSNSTGSYFEEFEYVYDLTCTGFIDMERRTYSVETLCHYKFEKTGGVNPGEIRTEQGRSTQVILYRVGDRAESTTTTVGSDVPLLEGVNGGVFINICPRSPYGTSTIDVAATTADDREAPYTEDCSDAAVPLVFQINGELEAKPPPVAVSGQWELRERTLRLYYVVPGKTGEGMAYSDLSGNLTVTENNEIRYKLMNDDGVLSISYTAPPATLIPEEQLRIDTPGMHYRGFMHGVFYRKELPPQDLPPDATYLTLEQTMFDRYYSDGSLKQNLDDAEGQYFLTNVPPGSEGEILVISCISGTQSHDIWINYIYDWVPIVYTPAPEEDEEGDMYPDGLEEDMEDGWAEDWGDYDSGTTDEELEEWLDRISGGNPFGDEGDEHTDPVETGVIDIIAILAAMLGLGGAGGGLGGLGGGGGPGGGDFGPYIRKDGDGDLLATDPVTGEERLYKQNPDGTYTNPLTGATVTEGELQAQLGSRAEHKGQIQQDLDAARQAIDKQREDNQNRDAPYADYNDAGLQIVIDKLNNNGSDYALALAGRLQDEKDKGKNTGSYDGETIERLQKNYSNYSQGHSIAGGEFPPGTSNWALAGETLGMVGAELTRPTGLLGIAGRGVLAMGTGGASEWVFNTAGAAMTMKDAIDAGKDTKDAVIAAGKEWGVSIVAGEALRGVGKALKRPPNLDAANRATAMVKNAGTRASNAKAAANTAAQTAKAKAARAGTLAQNTQAAQTALGKNTAALNKGKAQLNSAKSKLNGVEKQRQQLIAKNKAAPNPQTQKQLSQLNAQKNKLQLEVEKQTREVNYLSKQQQAGKQQLSSLKKETNLAAADAQAARKTADSLQKTAEISETNYNAVQQAEDAIRNPKLTPTEKTLADGAVAAGSLPIQDQLYKRE